jgi:hypothetical protein
MRSLEVFEAWVKHYERRLKGLLIFAPEHAKFGIGEEERETRHLIAAASRCRRPNSDLRNQKTEEISDKDK